MARRVLVKLPGPVRTIEFMALTGNARQRHDREKQGKQFHRAASITHPRRNTTPNREGFTRIGLSRPGTIALAPQTGRLYLDT